MKKLVLFCVVFAALIGGFWDGKIAAAPNNAVASIAITQPAPYTLGETLTFTTTVPKLKGYQYPMIDVQCYQDVDGDGTIEFGLPWDDIVYGALVHPEESVTLGAYVSIWTLRGGGPAECIANLDAFDWQGGVEHVSVLASVSFHVEG